MSAVNQETTDLVTCPVCGRGVPGGDFCGACGAHLVDGHGARARLYRYHAFAANPTEHVLQPTVVSTLFPHLPQRHTAPFRLALLLAAILLLALGVLRWTGPAIAAAALLVPLLYLLYMYEVGVYEDEPVAVLGATIVLDAVLGVIWAVLTGPLITRSTVQNLTIGAAPDRILVAAVLLPLAAQVVMLLGAVVVFVVRSFDEALDGFSFGAASALGFTAAMTVVNLLPVLRTGALAHVSAAVSLMDVLQRGLLVPFVNADTTGLIAAALWLRRGRSRTVGASRWATSLASAIAVAAAIDVVLGLSDTLADSLVYALAVRVVVAAVLVLLVRIALHHMLLSEAVSAEIGPAVPCAHCHRIVPRMAFCSHCGVALRATPKTGLGRATRAVR